MVSGKRSSGHESKVESTAEAAAGDALAEAEAGAAAGKAPAAGGLSTAAGEAPAAGGLSTAAGGEAAAGDPPTDVSEASATGEIPTAAAGGDAARAGSFSHKHLHCEVTGPEDGEPILLLHGWGSRAENMLVIAQALSNSYRVFNLDLPGHGRSPAPPHALGVPEHAALVSELIRARATKPVTIVGHSNGGRIALYMAGDPSMQALIRRLVLISPSGIKPNRPPSYYVKKYVARALKAPFEILPRKLREFGLDWLRHSLVWRALGSSDYRSLEGVMRDTFVRTVTFYVEDRLAEIRVPVLLFWGDRDTAVSRRQMQVLEEKIPNVGLVVLEGSAHYGYLDDFDTFIGATRHFLENS